MLTLSKAVERIVQSQARLPSVVYLLIRHYLVNLVERFH